MKKTLLSLVAAAGLAQGALAGQTLLALRYESAGTCVYNGTTTQTVETNYGASVLGLPYDGTTIFHFYSPAIITAPSLVPSDHAGATLYMKNTGTAPNTDFTVRGSIQFYDYDPINGVDALLLSTGTSANKNITHNSTTHWDLPDKPFSTATTLPAGHVLHVAVIINLISGNPAGIGQFLYDGPSGSTTVAQFPKNRVASWVFGSPGQAPDAKITAPSTVPAGSTGNIASVADNPGAVYSWAIVNGTITTGQGTSQITWTAGTAGPARLGVLVEKGCSSTGLADVTVQTGSAAPSPITLGINLQGDGSVLVSGIAPSGQSYVIQSAADLALPVWTPLGTTTADSNGVVSFVDTDAANYPARFYRALAQF